ncbi:MAG: hypothetical protein WCG42_03495 [Parachlamydiaceae bacterium]
MLHFNFNPFKIGGNYSPYSFAEATYSFANVRLVKSTVEVEIDDCDLDEVSPHIDLNDLEC